MHTKFLLFTAFISIAMGVFSQKYVEKADKSYQSQNFTTGVEDIKAAYEKISRKGTKAKKTKGELAYRVAESYRATEKIKDANEWYDRAILLEYQETNPAIFLYNAEMLRMMGDFDKAIKNYTAYKDLNPSDKRGEIGIESCKAFNQFKANKTTHVITNETSLNKSGLDMCPVFGDNKFQKMYFSSSRTGVIGAETDPRTGENYMDIWVSELDSKGNWTEPKQVPGKEINTMDNEGSVCFDGRFKQMFFTRCPNEKKKNLGCEIWVSSAKGKEWGEPQKVLLAPNDTITVGHPCASEDGKYLLFVSNLPGGFGGRDIWFSTYVKKTNSWSIPENLGPEINTAGDEMFPTFGKNGDLYFSSNGYVGMGGLDIFKATKVGEEFKWENPTNMGFPINSENNDYSLIEFTDKKGYFTSERKNTNGGGDNDGDIYSYDVPPNLFELRVIVSEVGQKSNKLEDVKIIVKGKDAANSWEGYTKKDGSILWDKKPNGDRYVSTDMAYTIAISKDGFQEDKKGAKFTTEGLKSNQTFVIEMALLPIEAKPIRLPEVRYPIGKAALLVDSSFNSKDSLNFVYELLKEYPGMVLELSSHTDARGSDDINQKLSEERATVCIDYLIKEKGVDARRLIAVGKGEREPASWKDPATGEKIVLTEQYINQFKKSDPKKFEMLNQLNRRTEGKIISMDFDPTVTVPSSEVKTETTAEPDPQK